MKLNVRCSAKEQVEVIAPVNHTSLDEVARDSTLQGQFLTIGDSTIPILLSELEKKDLTSHQRAWVLSLLYTFTGENDPREQEGLLGRYVDMDASWHLNSGNGISTSGLPTQFQSIKGSPIDEAKQKEFAERWKVWGEYFRVVTGKGEIKG